MGKEKLPDGWKWRNLKNECIINPSKPKDLQVSEHQETSFVPMECVDGDLGIVREIKTVPFQKVKKGYTYFEENDVLFAKITPCMQNKKSAIARNLVNKFGFGSTEFHVLRCKEQVIPEWIYYFVRNQQFVDEAEAHFTGAVGQQRVPKSFLEDYPLLVPPPDVQQEIVAKLDKQMAEIKRMKIEAQNELNNAEKLYKSYLTKSFENNRNLKAVKIGDLFNTRYGLSKSSVTDLSKTPAVRMNNITYEGGLVLDNLIYLDITEEEFNKHKLKKNDLLFNRTNSAELVGKTTVFDKDGDFVAVSYLVVATPKTDDINSKFVSYYLNTPEMKKYFVENCNRAISQANFNATKLSNIKVSIPDLSTQNIIVNNIENMAAELNKMKENLNNQLEAISQLPASILNEVFGKYEIPEEV